MISYNLVRFYCIDETKPFVSEQGLSILTLRLCCRRNGLIDDLCSHE